MLIIICKTKTEIKYYDAIIISYYNSQNSQQVSKNQKTITMSGAATSRYAHSHHIKISKNYKIILANNNRINAQTQ